MLLFRAEERIDRWYTQWKQPQGANLTIDQEGELAEVWVQQDESGRVASEALTRPRICE